MAKIPLFANWTWKLGIPEPFDSLAFNVSTTHYSTYCTVTNKKSTLRKHAIQDGYYTILFSFFTVTTMIQRFSSR